MMNTLTLQGRELRPTDIDFIRRLIESNPTMSRRKLSIALCEAWNWRNARGDLKDMASRTLMLKLHERGYIQLPERLQTPSNRMTHRHIEAVPHTTDAISCSLNDLQPLRVAMVLPNSADEALYNHLLTTYHYLSYKSTVGENSKYLVTGNDNQPLACLLFGSSAWSSSARDAHIGWTSAARQRNINYTTNNTRFLILPWVQVPHLASHILGIICQRIQQDWVKRYHHPVYLLETFVDKQRFKGTSYKAANWQYIGDTQGRSRNDRYHTMCVSQKFVFLYPLNPRYKDILSTLHEPTESVPVASL